MLSASPQVMAQQGAEPAVRAEQEANALAATLVGKMTTDEKLYQLLNTAPAIPRLGVPAYNWWTESLHGALGPVPTTNFPEPIGLAATFDAAGDKIVLSGGQNVTLPALSAKPAETLPTSYAWQKRV